MNLFLFLALNISNYNTEYINVIKQEFLEVFASIILLQPVVNSRRLHPPPPHTHKTKNPKHYIASSYFVK